MRYLLLILLSVQVSFSATYRVSKLGSDYTGDGTPANPWKTITKATSMMSGGDTVVIQSGNYSSEMIVPTSGSSSDRTCYMTYGSDTVAFTGTNVIYIDGKSYVSIHGDFRFYPSSGFTAKVYNNYQHIIFDGLTFHSPPDGGYAIHVDGNTSNPYSDVQGGDYLTVKNCTFYGLWIAGWNQWETDIISYNQTSHLLVDSCWFQGAGHYAINTFNCRYGVIKNSTFSISHGGIGLNAATHGFLVENNYTRGVALDSMRAGSFLQIEAESCIVRNSRFLDDSVCASKGLNNAGSITLYDDNVLYNSRDNRMYNNTLSGRYDVGSPTWADTSFTLWGDIRGDGLTGETERNYYLNNIFWKTRPQPGYLIENSNNAHSSPSQFTHYYNGNLLYNLTDATLVRYVGSGGEIGIYTVAQLKSSYPNQWGSSNMNASPLFSDTTDAIFALTATSPCVDAGVPLTTASGTGSDTQSLTVTDGLVLSDGFGGLVTPDSIWIEGASPNNVGISSGNRAAGTFTLTSKRSWSSGASIYLWRNGIKQDDIGYYQLTGAVAPPLPPDAPTISGPTGLSRTAFTANWGSVSDAAGYRLDVSTVSNFASFVTGYNDKAISGTSESLSGLSKGQTYYYRVRAYNAVGTSESSSSTSATTFKSLRGHR